MTLDVGGTAVALSNLDRVLCPAVGLTEDLLMEEERAWLNLYHARVRDTLSPVVDSETRAWLAHATRAI